MALYVIGDTHFSEGCEKPMDVFGGRWIGYRDKLIQGLSVLQEEDTLVLCGDFSWGMSLQEALPDFRLLDSFPGRKLLLKGNHDYWWETVAKMKRFFAEYHINSIDFLHNNCFTYNEVVLCGTRGWFFDKNDQTTTEDKIFKREVMRLEASLKCGKQAGGEKLLCFLHYPPVCGGVEVPQMTELLQRYNVDTCYYGHLHGEAIRGAFNGVKNGVSYRLVSADALSFRPVRIL